MRILKKLQRLRHRQLTALAEIVKDTVDFTQLGKQIGPHAGHFCCPQCGGPWFEVDSKGKTVNLGCMNCHYQTKGILANQIDQQGHLRCPKCHCKSMALIASDNILCCGCKKCDWELRSSLIPQDNEIILVS